MGFLLLKSSWIDGKIIGFHGGASWLGMEWILVWQWWFITFWWDSNGDIVDRQEFKNSRWETAEIPIQSPMMIPLFTMLNCTANSQQLVQDGLSAQRMRERWYPLLNMAYRKTLNLVLDDVPLQKMKHWYCYRIFKCHVQPGVQSECLAGWNMVATLSCFPRISNDFPVFSH